MWHLPDTETTQLFLVRHGATEANERRPYVLQGRGINFSLSESGRAQARAVGRFLSRFNIHAVYCSPLLRALETAAEIARSFKFPVETLHKIHEVDVGEWEGKSWNMIQEENNLAYQAFMNDPGDTPYLGGESYRDVLLRVKPELEAVIERHQGQSIVVVAHNVVNRAYLADVMGLDLKRAKDIQQSNCCVNIIHHTHGKAELMTLNAHFHLFEPEPPSAEEVQSSVPGPRVDGVAT
jgi:broad specificity phosphatase PhoE